MIDEKRLMFDIECDAKRILSHVFGEVPSEFVDDYLKQMEWLVNDQPKVGEWIPCSERLPVVEHDVIILAMRKYKDGNVKYITTIAMYEDGTIRENDSCWRWEDIEGEWDEEEDCYIIPEGWWESKKYNPDGVLNHAVDDVVIAWMPLPETYKPPAPNWKESMMKHFTKVE